MLITHWKTRGYRKKICAYIMGLESFCTLCTMYLASVIVDGIQLVSVMVDGKCKYLKISALQ